MDVDLQFGLLKPGPYYMQGAQACIEGALSAGLRVYAGYPITPASEIMEHAALRIPQTGGRYIQMEDELGSACALIGASCAGAKAMTATSGPGFSLMQEAISYGIISETPMVVVDVQRPGPGQGYTSGSQEDVMQARWGHHGEGSIIAISPASVQEMYDLTIEAFNLSELWRSPVLVMTEEVLAHMRERIVIPAYDAIEIKSRKKPQDLNIAPKDFLLSGHGQVPPMANWGEGYRVNTVGLVHHDDGNVTLYSQEMHKKCITRIKGKIEDNVDKIEKIECKYLEGCRYLLVCYGIVSRTAMEIVEEIRSDSNIPMGIIRLVTLWPFPERTLRHLVHDIEAVFMPEMNFGMMIHPVKEALRDRCDHFISISELGFLHTPEKIKASIMERVK